MCIRDSPYIEGTDDLLMSLNYVPITKYDTYIENKYGMKQSSSENTVDDENVEENEDEIEELEEIEE